MKKIKLDVWEFYHNFKYYDFYRTKVHKKDGTVIYGTMYKLNYRLTENERIFLSQWKNVVLFISQCQYAPEIKTSCIFLGDKCVKQ